MAVFIIVDLPYKFLLYKVVMLIMSVVVVVNAQFCTLAGLILVTRQFKPDFLLR